MRLIPFVRLDNFLMRVPQEINGFFRVSAEFDPLIVLWASSTWWIALSVALLRIAQIRVVHLPRQGERRYGDCSRHQSNSWLFHTASLEV